MKNTLIECFEESKEKESIISIFDEKDNIGNFHVGYVKEIFENSILIQSYNKYGMTDGLILIRLVDIFKVEKETEYLMKRMMPAIKYHYSSDEKQLDFVTTSQFNDGIQSLIDCCKNNNILISIKLIYSDYVTGYIIEYDDENLLIKTYSEYGVYVGNTFIKYEDILSIACDRQEERIISLLINRNK